MKKKLLITLDFPPEIGGIQNYLFNIVKYEYKNIDMVLTTDTGVFTEILDSKILRVKKRTIFGNKKFSLISMIIPYLKICFKNEGNLIIECGNIYAAIIPFITYPITKKDYFIYTYGTELLSLDKKTFKSIMLRKIIRNASIIYTLGNPIRKILEKKFTNNIIIKPPKIRLSEKYIKPNIIHNRDKIKLLAVGRLVAHKGFLILIDAIKILVEKNMNIYLSIIGDGPDKDNLRDKIESYSLTKDINILENISAEELIKFYKKSDIFILPSLKIESGMEGFGIVLLEAMNYSLPIIASNSGGIPEVLSGGECGLLVEPDNVNNLSDTIKMLIDNPDLSDQLTRNAYSKLELMYVWK